MAVELRTKHHVRHASLLLAVALIDHPKAHGRLVGDTIYGVVQRADELAELLSLYWKDKKRPLTAQLKKGLARAFRRFDEYQLAKYDRKSEVRFRDVLFLCHAKAKDTEQNATWKRLIAGELKTPDTWEVNLSTGGDKRETFERLLREGKLGYLALLRNLRNMVDAGVDDTLIRESILTRARRSRTLPFRFVAAARAVPQLERELDAAMLSTLRGRERLPGRTRLLIDVSGSMEWLLSEKSQLSRMDAAGALAALLGEIAEQLDVWTFSSDVVRVPPRQRMALIDAIQRSQVHASTYMGKAVRKVGDDDYDRLIVVTDEQSHDVVGTPKGRGYLINVSTNKNGVGYGVWTHIDGFSEAVVDYIQAMEAEFG